MRRFIILTLTLLLAISIFSGVQAQSDSEVRIYVFGPANVATNSVTSFDVNVVGGPGSDGGNYSLKVYLEGTNLTGAKPTKSSPLTPKSETGNFTINVTAPRSSQTITLVINATSQKDSERMYSEYRHEIQVIEPIVISAKIENTGDVDLRNVVVKFYVDGDYIGDQSITYLGAKNSTTISYEWLATGVQPGRHEVIITVDMNGDGVIDEQDGDLVISKYFYKEYGEIHPAIIVTVAVLMIIVILILIRTIRKKRRGW